MQIKLAIEFEIYKLSILPSVNNNKFSNTIFQIHFLMQNSNTIEKIHGVRYTKYKI